MYIDITGYEEFEILVRNSNSSSESDYDYIVVSTLDGTLSASTTQTSNSNVEMNLKGVHNASTGVSAYTSVKYTGIDGGSHRITIMYRKDGSYNYGDDRGYVLIPKNQ